MFAYCTLFKLDDYYEKKALEMQKTELPTYDYDHEQWKARFDDKTYKKLFKAFRSLSKNKDEPCDHRLFLTEQSLK